MTDEQRMWLARVWDMNETQLKATLYQIIIGDDIKTAIDKITAKKPRVKRVHREGFFE